jgi:hypothetical protein
MSVIKIEDWTVIHRTVSPLLAAEGRTLHLKGRVWNHPRWPAGGAATTSPVVGRLGNLIMTKSGSVYELGKACAEYAAQFTDAAQELLQSLPDI